MRLNDVLPTYCKLLIYAATLGVVAAASSFGDSHPSAVQSVLLRNGEVLQGQVSHRDGRVVVQLEDGAVVTLQQWDVACCESSKGATFVRLRESLNRARTQGTPPTLVPDIDSNQALVEWCLEHRLWDQCEMLIAEVARSGGSDAAESLRIRLDLAQAAEKRTAIAQPPSPQRPADSLRSIDLVPSDVLGEFCTFVQPLLTNSCVRCHSAHHDSEFTLHRQSGRSTNRKLTQANLLAVVAAIEQRQLISACESMHGFNSESEAESHFAQAPSASWRHDQLARLKAWSERVAGAASAQTAGALGPSDSKSSTHRNDPFDPADFNAKDSSNDDARAPSTE